MPSKSTSILIAAALLCAVGCSGENASQPQAGAGRVAEVRQVKPVVPEASALIGWGTLRGSFRYRGEIPQPQPMNVAAGPDCPPVIVSEALVVDPATRGVADVLIYARKVSRVHGSYASEPGQDVVMRSVDCRLVPHVVGSTLKDTFVFRNDDRATHNVKPAPLENPVYGALVPVGGKPTEYKYTKPLSYPRDVTCSIHPWEKAWHIVRPDPYFAVTAADGTFEIKNLPTAEEIEFQVWHERGAADGSGLRADPKWDERGRFKLTIPKAGGAVTMDVEVDAEKFRD